MRFLITGVAGFVGRHLVQYLSSVYPSAIIFGVDVVQSTDIGQEIKDFHYRPANLLDKEKVLQLMAEARPDRIVHLASFSSVSYSWENPSESFLNNSLIFINIIEAVRHECPECRLLSVGSSEEYGKADHLPGPIAENHPLSPTSPYAVARVSQEMLSAVFAKGYGLDIVMTRSFNHIGPYQRDSFVLPSFAKQFIQAERAGQKKLELLCGDLEVVRDFTDVRDVVRAYDLLLRFAERGEVYNVCSGRGQKLLDVIRLMEKLTGIEALLNVDKSLIRPLENRSIVGDNSKIAALCGWQAERSFESSVADVLEYWRTVVQ
jgi:GDP-4-dehydro-6-deoxy-D-mannose reductase